MPLNIQVCPGPVRNGSPPCPGRPGPHEVFDEAATSVDGVDDARRDGYFGRAFDQFACWSVVATRQRARAAGPGAFDKDPSQRNAP